MKICINFTRIFYGEQHQRFGFNKYRNIMLTESKKKRLIKYGGIFVAPNSWLSAIL